MLKPTSKSNRVLIVDFSGNWKLSNESEFE